MAKSGLEGDGRPNARRPLPGFRGRDGNQHIPLSPVYGWSKKGRRAHCSVPRNRGKNTTLLASMSVEGMGPSLAVEGATTAAVFEADVERILTPTLRRGQVVVMDNLSAHK